MAENLSRKNRTEMLQKSLEFTGVSKNTKNAAKNFFPRNSILVFSDSFSWDYPLQVQSKTFDGHLLPGITSFKPTVQGELSTLSLLSTVLSYGTATSRFCFTDFLLPDFNSRFSIFQCLFLDVYFIDIYFPIINSRLSTSRFFMCLSIPRRSHNFSFANRVRLI